MTYDKLKGGKPKLCGIDPLFVQAMAKVQEFGDQKHASHHWSNGVSYRLVLEAVKRHIEAIELGGDLDPETSQHHAAHAACGLMYIAYYDREPDKFREFYDLPFARRSNGLAAGPISESNSARRFDKIPGGGSGAFQESKRPVGAGGSPYPPIGPSSFLGYDRGAAVNAWPFKNGDKPE